MTGRPLGVITRGTTNPNRLRRVDRWITTSLGPLLARAAPDPLVVDLGFGATPVTVVELHDRLRRVRPDVRVVGVEIDPVRVAAAQPMARPPGLTFEHGGFELAGLRPVLVRALNVLRQYGEAEVAPAWATIGARLSPDGLLVEGTCDELGRLGTWLTVGADAQPRTLTLSAHLAELGRPARWAERLPKALIHHNVAGHEIHALLTDLDHAWSEAAAYAPFGPRQRFARAVSALTTAGWPVRREPRAWRRGELTLTWPPECRDQPGPPVGPPG